MHYNFPTFRLEISDEKELSWVGVICFEQKLKSKKFLIRVIYKPDFPLNNWEVNGTAVSEAEILKHKLIPTRFDYLQIINLLSGSPSRYSAVTSIAGKALQINYELFYNGGYITLSECQRLKDFIFLQNLAEFSIEDQVNIPGISR